MRLIREFLDVHYSTKATIIRCPVKLIRFSKARGRLISELGLCIREDLRYPPIHRLLAVTSGSPA